MTVTAPDLLPASRRALGQGATGPAPHDDLAPGNGAAPIGLGPPSEAPGTVLFLAALRRRLGGRGHCALTGRDFRTAFGPDGPDALAAFDLFIGLTALILDRPLSVAPPGSPPRGPLTRDEAALVAVLARAAAGAPLRRDTMALTGAGVAPALVDTLDLAARALARAFARHGQTFGPIAVGRAIDP